MRKFKSLPELIGQELDSLMVGDVCYDCRFLSASSLSIILILYHKGRYEESKVSFVFSSIEDICWGALEEEIFRLSETWGGL